MLSHTSSYGSEKEGILTGANCSHIKWIFRFFDKLGITSMLQGSAFPFQQLTPSGRISLPLSHLHGEHREPSSSPGTACLGTLQGWGGTARQSKPRGEVWFKHNLRLKISFRSTFGFFCSPFPTPQILQTSLLRHQR